MKLLQVSKS